MTDQIHTGYSELPVPEIHGVIFPLQPGYIRRFFDDSRTVFVKPATVYKNLRRGMKLVFYQTGHSPGCVGEGIIERILISEDPHSFIQTYGEALLFTESELNEYIQNRKKTAWLAIELRDLMQYPDIIRSDHNIPPGGRYLRR